MSWCFLLHNEGEFRGNPLSVPDLICREVDLRSEIELWCKNQTLNESVLTFNQKNVESNAFDVQILVFVRCHLHTTPGLNNKCPNVWKPHKLFSSKFLRQIIPGIIAYPAGCTLVLYNPRKNKQQHITNPSKKTITSAGWWVLVLALTSGH